MRLTPESKSVFDTLLTGGTLSAVNISIGPLDTTTRLLLQVLIDNYETLSTDRGVQQAEILLKFYLIGVKQATVETTSNSETSQPERQNRTEPTQEKIEPETSPDVLTIPSFETPPNWRLHELKCRSIKGVAPAGEEFPFSFDGKSNLLFGPNGSGKSSLLGAVMWVLTGLTLTDDHEQKEVMASIHKISEGTKRGSKICDWPPIATLPDTKDPSSFAPDSRATIQLKSSDNKTTLYFLRTIENGLEVSLDYQDWAPCPDLSKYGINPLDLQLSIEAPTIFGRQAIETAKNSRKILSLMLGYKSLEDIGDLVGNCARNRTSFFNTLTQSTDAECALLWSKIAALPDFLTQESKLKEKLKALQSLPKLSSEKIREIKQYVIDQITKASASLAKILGITNGETPVPTDLDENLIKAIGHLEKGFSEVFPSLSSVTVETVLPEKKDRSPEEQLQDIEESLQNFVGSVQTKIEERLRWWRKETEPGSKATLLLLAADSYKPAKMECPVCEQSVDGLPVKDELESLKALDPKLREDIKLFFVNLVEQLERTIPENIRDIAKVLPKDRLLYDWENLKKENISSDLSPIIEDFEAPVTQLITSMEKITTQLPQLLPQNTEHLFLQSASSFISKVNCAYTALAILCWANTKLSSLIQRLSNLITAPSTENADSLLSVLSEGKPAVQERDLLKLLLAHLSEVDTAIGKISENQNKLKTLKTLKVPFDSLKKLSKYAVTKTTTIFNEIKDKAIINWKLLYPENSTGLYPSRLVMAGVKDKSIESLLTHGDYEVPGPPFANAGLQRAIALSFLCALFDKHPNGLGFVIFDDPILSLDEDHRESWSALILSPRMQHTQVILATHQMQFLTNCGYHFDNGQVIMLNHRDRRRRISYQPGNHLDRSEELIETNWDLVPCVLYNYCEGLLETLDSYSPEGFFIKDNLTKSLNDYEKLSFPNPLASRRQKEIVTHLRKPIIRSVSAGRHEPTKHNVSKSMVRTALNELKQLNKIFVNELEDLKRLKARERKGTVIQIPSFPFPDIAPDAVFKNPLIFPTIGRAAARPDSWILDSSDQLTKTKFAPHTSIFISSNTLNPVIKYGECAFLADEEKQPRDDDLVAVVSNDGDRYLRKLWSDKESYLLQAIHPTKPVPAVRTSTIKAAMRKVIGVLYNTPLKPVMHPSSKTLEWYPFSSFPSKIIANFSTLVVEGDSLEPVARQGQRVLLDDPENPQNTFLEQGGLAALEIEDESIGNVIKKVYRKSEHWILVSPNPIYAPDIVTIEQIKSIWPLRGILFETIDEEG